MRRIVLFLLLLSLILVLGCSESSVSYKNTVVFFDVGQGDCCLIVTDSGRGILIDTGDGISSEKISSKLSRYNIHSLELLVLTHGHDDHVGGFPDLITDIDIKRIITLEGTLNAIDTKRAELKGSQITTVLSGDSFTVDNVTLDVLWPYGVSDSVENDYCIVLKAVVNGKIFAFTGDVGVNEERSLLDSGVDLKSDVLKVGHHGSSGSSSEEFIAAVDPAVAVISVGKNNSYGLPDKEVRNASPSAISGHGSACT
ncbi:MAG: MBL fold metallo-hydrolase, partial [Clostridia bacterium]|nr:MBL fold metallo-hydrolase [Clostridia bacterium]